MERPWRDPGDFNRSTFGSSRRPLSDSPGNLNARLDQRGHMIEQNAKRKWKRQGICWCIIGAVCICVAAALMHAQASDHLASNRGFLGEMFETGWPFFSTMVSRVGMSIAWHRHTASFPVLSLPHSKDRPNPFTASRLRVHQSTLRMIHSLHSR